MAEREKSEIAKAESLGHQYDKIVFCRNLLIWVHVVLAFATAFTYLSTRDYSHFAWWRRGSGTIQLVRALIPVSPYAWSGILASKFETASLVRICGFCVILALGTGVIGWLYASHRVEAFSDWLDVPFLFVLLPFCFAQAMLFTLAANLFLDVELESPNNPPWDAF
jgi:hypothetical protein